MERLHKFLRCASTAYLDIIESPHEAFRLNSCFPDSCFLFPHAAVLI